MKTLFICITFTAAFIVVAVTTDYVIYRINKWYHEKYKNRI